MTPSGAIVAVASTPGRSGRGVIRLSGAGVAAALQRWLGPCPARIPTRVVVPLAPDRQEDGSGPAPRLPLPALALRFDAPRSFTGEDVAELLLPGNPRLLERVVDGAIVALGELGVDLRRAGPGEFTARAFLNGRLDLLHAEGIAAAIAARGDAELRAARSLLAGGPGRAVSAWSAALAEALALVEAGIDFTEEEDVVAVAPPALVARLEAIRSAMAGMLDGAAGLEQLRGLPRVALAGPPNAGKSSLFNALLGRHRVVESAVAGTTRDAIEAPLVLRGAHGEFEVLLVDLPGEAPPRSALEQAMQQAAAATIEAADVVLRCDSVVEPQEPGASPAGRASRLELAVATKSDLLPASSRSATESAVRTSAATGAGLDELRAVLARVLADAPPALAADALVLSARARAALAAALEAVEEAETLAREDGKRRTLAAPELAAALVRRALDRVGDICGRVDDDDVLALVFARFCVGK